MSLFDKLSQLEAHFEETEPFVRAFLPEEKRFERLRADARRLLEGYPDERFRPLLFGVTLGVKDIFHVEGFPTRAGSKLPPEVLLGPQAESVTRLQRAGALIVGKTVTTEFAYFAPGPTRNPHNPEHTPGGSSSGSAAAVAAGLCQIALGTQTIGSVNRPAAFCGVVGFKPSYERISRQGVIPLSPSLDHVGLFAADVVTARHAASVLIPDWQINPPARKPTIGVPEGPYLKHAEVGGLAHFRGVCEQLAESGYPLKSIPVMPDFEAIIERHRLILAAEAARVHERWFADYGHLYHPKTAELIRRGQQISDEELQAALGSRTQLREQLMAQMEAHGIDLWLSPSAPGPAPKGLESTGNPVMNLPWTHSGLPTLTLPAGVSEDGLPLGLQLTGRWYGDEVLFEYALLLEGQLQ